MCPPPPRLRPSEHCKLMCLYLSVCPPSATVSRLLSACLSVFLSFAFCLSLILSLFRLRSLALRASLALPSCLFLLDGDPYLCSPVFSLPVYVPIYPSTLIYVFFSYLLIYLSIYLSMYLLLFTSLRICLSTLVEVSIHLFVYLFLSIRTYSYLSFSILIFLPTLIHVPAYPFICLFLSIFYSIYLFFFICPF